ncbi:hypothetical protein [Abyssisolibacter fermentans]|uniref:hypothetical protein n=1 Tax=Abyssisolibacter fermentans TaxID=1766203 RepID=UPI00082F70F1|nr:hypothetical protein [Abyssisolibacter fermentans]
MGKLSIRRYQHIHNLLVNEAFKQIEVIKFKNVKNFLKADSEIELQQLPKLLNQTLLPISLYDDDLCAGICCLHDIDWENRNTKVKFIFDEKYNDLSKKNYINEYIKLICNFITSHFYIIKIDGVVIDNNEIIDKIIDDNFFVQNHIKGNGVIYVTRFLKKSESI